MSGQHKKKRENRAMTGAADPLFDVTQVASATECTGVLPAQPETAGEADAAAEMESIHSRPRRSRED